MLPYTTLLGARAASYGAKVSRLQRRPSDGIPLDATFPRGLQRHWPPSVPEVVPGLVEL